MMQVTEMVNEAANAVAESLEAMVFVFSGAIDHKGFGGLIKTMQFSDQQPRRPNALLILTTFGGYADQAYRIARQLQNLTDKFYLCVPTMCKSAGTLIALGANEIYMPPDVAQLGPLDVQIRRRDEIGQRRSGMVVRTALDCLSEETFKVFEQVMLNITLSSGHSISFDVASRVASQIATGVMSPVYAQVDPESLGNDLRDLSEAAAYGERLVEHGGNATKDTVKQLVEGYPTHNFIIDSEEARNLFRTVNDPTREMLALTSSLGETAYSVQVPHVILRLDGNLNDAGVNKENVANSDTQGTAAVTGVDGRCKAARRSDHQGS